MKRLLVLGVAALVTVAGCSSADPQTPETPTAAPSPNDAALARFYDQQLTWSNCGGRFECATLTVPLTYEQPDGETIDIDVVKLPAEDQSKKGRLAGSRGPHDPGELVLMDMDVDVVQDDLMVVARINIGESDQFRSDSGSRHCG